MIIALKIIKTFSPSLFKSAYYNLGLRTYQDLIMYYWGMLTFDFRYQVKTSKIIPVDKLNFGNKKLQSHAVRYRPSPVLCITKSLRKLKVYDTDVQKTSFVDYGSGMGRVMILAAEAEFSSVIGLELSSELNAICKSNIDQYLNKRPQNKFSIVESDAGEFLPPGDVCVFFFFRPFDKTIHDKVMTQIMLSVKQTPRTIYCLALQCDYNFLKYGMNEICYETGVTIYTNSSVMGIPHPSN